MYCSLLLWDRRMLLENECRHRDYDCSLVLGLISCHLHWSQLNACIFCAICSLKCYMKLYQARDENVSLVSAAILNLQRPVRGWFTSQVNARVYPEKNTSLSSSCMCIVFCHHSSSATFCWPILLAFLLDDTNKSLFATSARRWQKSNTRNV